MRHYVIYIPGLNDDRFINQTLIEFFPKIWKKYYIDVHIFHPHWSTGKEFKPKLQEVTKFIDQLSNRNSAISLIGQSAGGSAVINAFSERKNKIHRVINVCGRLSVKRHVTPILRIAASRNPAFYESVLLCEDVNEPRLTHADRKKILTIRPFFDEVVPVSTVSIAGAKNIIIPSIGHSLSGILALTLFAKHIVTFINT